LRVLSPGRCVGDHEGVLANGDQDLMVRSSNSQDLARRLPDTRLELYPDAGHGGIFEHHEAFVSHALEFLGDDEPDRLTAA
jgi:pimeloyl-ACP methyl ester carboxylesterase